MKDGFGAPFIRAWFNTQEITASIEDFKYVSSEDDEEECDITVKTDDKTLPDQPAFQEGVMWTIIWGWINGTKSNMRKIWLYDMKWGFDDNQISGTLSFSEKGKSTKQRDSKKVYQGPTGILPVLDNIADTHGLTAVVETTDSAGKPIVISQADLKAAIQAYFGRWDYMNNPKVQEMQSSPTYNFGPEVANGQQEPVSSFKGDWNKVLLNNFVDLDTGIDLESFKNHNDQMAALLNNFLWGKDVAQGNKTDKQLLDELGRKQPSGLYISDTTDDEIRLKRRDFDQSPKRAYTWSGEDGELIAFQPESKQKAKNGSAVNLNYDGWDKTNKTYFNGSANVGNDVVLSDNAKKTLAKYQKELAELNARSFDKDTDVLGYVSHIIENSMAADATARPIIIRTPVTLLDKKTALINTINTFNTNNKNFNDPSTDNPYDTFSHASNNRQDAELNMNPGYIEAFGDPTILKGMIITVMGVSKKYSGNYYTTRVEHQMGGGKKYTIHCDIVRQGHNIKTNDSYVDYKQSGKSLNKDIGSSETPLYNTRILGTTSNP